MKIAQVILILVLACLDLTKASSSKAAKANDAKAKIEAQHIIAPFKCPGSCVVGEVNSDGILEADVRQCTAEVDNDNYNDQVLIVHDNDMFTKLESATHSGQCVGVIEGTPESEGGMCGGKVGFVSCELPAAQWYFTGGRFLSAACWALGLSSVLAVDEGCSALGVRLAMDNDVAINPTTLTQTFMLLEPPKFIEEKMVGAGPLNGCYTCSFRKSWYCCDEESGPKKEDGGSCYHKSMCISDICEDNKCVCSACASTGGPWYCYGGACREKLNDGEPCGDDNDCKSDNCSGWSWSSDRRCKS